jgi:hypothetical protein
VVGAVIEIIRGAAEYAEEMVVAALEWAKIRQEAEMPFANQRRGVACGPKQRWQCRMAWRQPYVLRRVSADRLLQANCQPILIAARDQPRARGRTYRGIRVCLCELRPFKRKPVYVWRRVVLLAIATHIGKAEVVGKDKNDVRLGGLGIGTT